MARTRHKHVTKVVARLPMKQGSAKNSDLKTAAHQGAAPVANPKNAPSGYSVVPTSIATMPPGAGPLMSSDQPPVGRGRGSNRSAKNSTSKGVTASSSNSAPGAYAIQGAAKDVSVGKRAKSRSRGKRKR